MPTGTLSRRRFLRRSLLVAAGLAAASCERSHEPDSGSPGPLPPDRPPKQVIIIGAGISGLVAGYELSRAGHEVTLLEAGQRVGGRVRTLRASFSGGFYAEAGAARIPPDHDLTLAYVDHFGLMVEPFYPGTDLYVDLSNGERSLIRAADYLELPPWPGSVTRANYMKISGGMDQLPLTFARAMEGTIHLMTPVESITQTSGSVRVRSTDGAEFFGDKVLCTVALPVMNRIHFEPALSNEKLQAINGGFDYSAGTRIFLQCTERFWEAEGMNGWGNTDLPEEIWSPTWDQAGQRGVLLSYLLGEPASLMDQLSEEDRILNVLNRFDRVFPDVFDFYEAGTSYSWANHPWSGGAFARPDPDQDAALGGHIGTPEGRIHFAGEHASEHRGWIQGALASGLRASMEIHESD